MKKLGVLGGMGPLCTASFYKKLVEFTKADCDQDHIPTIIISDCGIPDRSSTIITGKDRDLLLSKAKDDLETLEKLGVSNIAIPCNTMHYYIEKLQSFTKVNIINMIYETLKYCNEKSYKNIAVLGTLGTTSYGIYEKYAGDFDIDIYKLSDEQKNFVMETIYKIKASKVTSIPEFIEFVENLKKEGVDGIILACTELSIIDNLESYPYIVDAMDVLAKESVKKMGYELAK